MERSANVTLGPLFTAGVVLVAIGARKHSTLLVAAGAAAIVADQRLPASRRLKDRLRKTAAQG